MNYPEALEYLLSLQNRGIKLDLSRMRDCLEALGRPQDSFDSILVAGTNGKGSTASALASILSEPARPVGLFTSPHLLEYRERIRIGGRLIERETLARQVDLDHRTWERFELTFFEATAALALSIFRRMEVDVAVLEIGLGGRLDATNVVDPILSVISQIGRDHVHILGDDLAGIALEKAGILRAGVPAVVSGGIAAATEAIAGRAAELGSPLYARPRCLRVANIMAGAGSTRFEVARRSNAPPGFRWSDRPVPLETGMTGLHQVSNGSLALLAATVLRGNGERPSDAQIATGLARWRWPGRLERPRHDLPLYADAAHNRESARALVSTLLKRFRDREIRLVTGLVAKKDHRGFYREMSRIADRVWIACPSTPRAATQGDLISAARESGLKVIVCGSIAAAIEQALNGGLPENGVVVLTGSLFTLDDGYRHLGVQPRESLWEETDFAEADR